MRIFAYRIILYGVPTVYHYNTIITIANIIIQYSWQEKLFLRYYLYCRYKMGLLGSGTNPYIRTDRKWIHTHKVHVMVKSGNSISKKFRREDYRECGENTFSSEYFSKIMTYLLTFSGKYEPMAEKMLGGGIRAPPIRKKNQQPYTSTSQLLRNNYIDTNRDRIRTDQLLL